MYNVEVDVGTLIVRYLNPAHTLGLGGGAGKGQVRRRDARRGSGRGCCAAAGGLAYVVRCEITEMTRR